MKVCCRVVGLNSKTFHQFITTLNMVIGLLFLVCELLLPQRPGHLLSPARARAGRSRDDSSKQNASLACAHAVRDTERCACTKSVLFIAAGSWCGRSGCGHELTANPGEHSQTYQADTVDDPYYCGILVR
jgi:hypothetical protein